ncbi:MlaD family protein [Nocardia sp. NBC_01503]|uniref:MlaD family protein n=1 Tax=Nocardia sp. NBC_01503 TaxID=2975997 RepID=UPI002E7BF211|nr:MlaD family protein [Nocardia sp. NBC_01503]WTL32143.1 MlaD family protein [Nocardia sp. NBC_01503]
MLRRYRGLLILTAIATVALAVGTTVATDTNSGSTKGFCAIMPDTIGLYPGNFVTRMGVRIGTVDRTDPEGAGVRVTFSLDDSQSIAATTKAVTRSTSILADRSIELTGNNQPGPHLTPGHCIPLSDTATPKSISEITAATAGLIDGITRSGTTSAANGALDNLSSQLAGNGAAAGAAVTTLSHALADPDHATATLGQLLADIAPLLAATRTHWDDIESALATAPPGIDAVATQVFPAITKIFDGLPGAMDLCLDLAQRYGTLLWPGLDTVAAALHLAATGEDSIAQLANSLPVLADSIATLTNARTGQPISGVAPRFRLTTMPGQPEASITDLLQLVLKGGVPQ